MEPVFGFALYFAACAVVWVVARKRGRAGWPFVLSCLVAAPVLVRLIAGSGGSGAAAGFAVFLLPAGALGVILSLPTSEQAATSTGAHGEFKKCPFCAESVRHEAIKCKHCGSDLAAS